MEWIAQLRRKVVGLDTAPLIYFIEENPLYLDIVRPFFDAMDLGLFSAVTSTVTLLEVLVYPFRQGDMRLAQQYRDILLNAEWLTMVPLTNDIAEEASRLRAAHALRTPDAVQIATARHREASFFLTNDARLPSLPELRVLILGQFRDSLRCPGR